MKKITTCFFLFCFSTALYSQYSVLLNFNDTNGENPYGSLILDGSKLYGMTFGGGKYSAGNVFSVDTNGGGTDLYDFITPYGMNPWGSLTRIGSRLYGLTSYGGANNDGNIFSIDSSGNGYQDIIDFKCNLCATDAGTYPLGSLTQNKNKFYLTFYYGGTGGYGHVISIDTNGAAYKDIVDFTGTNGENPYCDLVVCGNKLFGMASAGGANNRGCVFSVDTGGGGYKDILDFNITNGYNPWGSIRLIGTRLFGMTHTGGSNNMGCIFSIDTSGSGYKDLLDFNGTNGKNPYGSFTVCGRTMYAMTNLGGANGYGCIFSIDTSGSGFTHLYDFLGTDGAYPYGDLTLSGSTLYGMTYGGGSRGVGVVFKLSNMLSLGINQINKVSKNVKVFPNPSNGLFTVELSSLKEKPKIEVYNMVGESIYESLLNTTTTQIDLSKKSVGVYFYKIVSKSGDLISEGKLINE